MNFQFAKIPLPAPICKTLPKVARIRQIFRADRIHNLGSHLTREFGRIRAPSLRGKRIAVTAGSRGIKDIPSILKRTVDYLKGQGAKPFIVPAMGSHGAATAEGQLAALASYGITEKKLDVPIVSSLDVVKMGELEDGTPVYCDKAAQAADGIVLCNRVKAHTDFKGDYESGLLKMLVIGLGNHIGASSLHQSGFAAFPSVLVQAGRLLLAQLPVLFGIAIVENAYDETMLLEAVPADHLFDREKALLKTAKSAQAGIMLDEIDVLIIDEIGKNISGSGMDPNVTGRPGSGLPGFHAPRINKIVVRSISDQSHGNAIGIGLADITSLDCVKTIDFRATYLNAATATVLASAKLPVVAVNDQEAIALSVSTCNRPQGKSIRLVRIKSTLDLETLWVSEAYQSQIHESDRFEILSDFQNLTFSEQGALNGL